MKYKKCCGSRFLIHPDSLMGRLIRLYSIIDEMAASVFKRYNFPCKEGCSDCCSKTMFAVSFIEFDYVKYGLQNMPQTDMKRLEERVISQAEDMLKKTPEVFEDLPQYSSSITTIGEWKKASWLKERIYEKAGNMPCPLLENEKCIVYKYRPYTCRVLGPLRPSVEHLPCDLINKNALSYQMTIPTKLMPFNALGIYSVGKPLLVWLYTEIKNQQLYTFTHSERKIVFETPASMVYYHGKPIPKSSLDQ